MSLALLLAALAAPAGEVAPLPDREGFAGPFAGVTGGGLLVAGGANFPDKKPWEGGAKVWYDRVWVLDRPDGAWRAAGRLPRPLAYGVAVSHGGGVVCAGGSNERGHFADAFRLHWRAGRLLVTPLPPLAVPLANAAGALVGDTLYVIGGLEKPDAATPSRAAYRLDLSAAGAKWVALDPCPGPPRMLAAAAACDGALWVVGGVTLTPAPDGPPRRVYLRDAYRLDPARGWTRVADLPGPLAAAPSPAPADARGFWLLGGDDGSQVGVAPDRHRGFRKTVLRYSTETGRWTEAAEVPSPRVTVPCVPWRGGWVIPSGEVRPGVRTPTVAAFPAKAP